MQQNPPAGSPGPPPGHTLRVMQKSVCAVKFGSSHHQQAQYPSQRLPQNFHHSGEAVTWGGLGGVEGAYEWAQKHAAAVAPVRRRNESMPPLLLGLKPCGRARGLRFLLQASASRASRRPPGSCQRLEGGGEEEEEEGAAA